MSILFHPQSGLIRHYVHFSVQKLSENISAKQIYKFEWIITHLVIWRLKIITALYMIVHVFLVHFKYVLNDDF